MQKKLLVSGAAGFVAGSVIIQALSSWEVHAVDVIEIPASRNNLYLYTLDLMDYEQVANLFYRIKPDAVIHTAALADIDFCQSNQALAGRINVGVTEDLWQLCQRNGAKFVFCSTDTVFDGEKGNYTEKDLPRSVNFYAETKIRAEKLLADKNFNAVIARLSLVMGLPVLGRGNSFISRTIEKLKNDIPVEFPENEIRTPVDVVTLGSALLELAGNNFRGTIHLAGNDRINRYEMARQIASTLGYSPDLILPANSNQMPGRARRPNDVSLNNHLAREILKTTFVSLKDGLNRTINFREREQLS